MRNYSWVTTGFSRSLRQKMAPTKFPTIQLIFTYLIALFWGTYVLLRSLWEIIKKGPSKFFYIKDRSDRPQVLDNPDLGTHAFVKLSQVFNSVWCICWKILADWKLMWHMLQKIRKIIMWLITMLIQIPFAKKKYAKISNVKRRKPGYQ